MCGIAGVFNFRAAHDLDAVLRAMARVQTHRGPDDEGIWHDPAGRCSLAHRRLAIIDTSDAGHQPMVSSDGRWIVSFNGEIYNFMEVRADLESTGASFRGRSDTEVLLQALSRWGIDALSRIDGMYAFAAFDRTSGQMFLARDAFGEKPLYYVDLPDYGLAFASELQALEHVPGVDLDVSVDAVAELLMFQYIGAPRTIYRQIRKLPPGHWLVAAPGQPPRIGRHFEFKPGADGFDGRSSNALADELEDILVRSLRRRLIADVPLGAFLSGGVDSSTVCAIVRRRLEVPLKTYSIGFSNAPESEHETARSFAGHLGTEHNDKIITPNTSEFLFNIGRVLDEPNADSSCLPTYLLSAFARESVTVALSGDGGDELFGGYGRYFETLDEQRKYGHGNGAWHAGQAYYSNRILVFLEKHIEELLGHVPAGAEEHLRQLRYQVGSHDQPLHCRIRKTDVENYMPGAVLQKVDRMSMQHSLEVRTPFLSVELARFAERLPAHMLYDGKRGKLLLREVAYRYLPRELVDLPKQGFGLPMSRWAKNELLAVTAKSLESDDSRLAAAVGREAITRFMRRQRSVGGFAAYQVWALAMLESWLRHHPARFPRAKVQEGVVTQRGRPPANATHEAPDGFLASTVWLWPMANDLVFATPGLAMQPDDPLAVRGEALALFPELHDLLYACRGTIERDENAQPFAAPRALPIETSWSELFSAEAPASVAGVLARSTLLLQDSTPLMQMSWQHLERLRQLKVAQLVARHPYRDDGAVFLLRLKPRQSTWRELRNIWRLRMRGSNRFVLTAALREQGRMHVAGPLAGVPAIDQEMSDRFMLFEGGYQLPPLPTTHQSIRENGDGRYSIWGGHAFFSRRDGAARSRSAVVWSLERTVESAPLLPFSPEIVIWPRERDHAVFFSELSSHIGRDANSPAPVPMRAGDRIVVLTHALPPGGAERQWCYLALELQRQGYDVQFVTVFQLDGQNRHYLAWLESEGITVNRLDELVPADVLKHMPANDLARQLATHRGNPFGVKLAELTSLLIRLQPRAVFAQLDYTNLLAAVAGCLSSVPQVVVSFRNYNPSRFSYIANGWFRPLYAVLLQSRRIILSGNSRAANEDYARWIGIDERRIALVPNAIDASQFPAPTEERRRRLRTELGIDKNAPVMLGVFRLNEEKRPVLFIEICARIAAAVPGLRVFVVGVGPFESAVRQKIEELALERIVTLLGRRDDVTDLMSVSSVLLLTSILEGMPNVLMEAQLMGTPVVAAAVGGVPDCVIDGRTGYVVDPDDSEAMIRRCIETLVDGRLAAQLGRNGTSYMRSFFSRDSMARRYLQLLGEHEDIPPETHASPDHAGSHQGAHAR